VSEGKTLNEALVNNEEIMDRVEQLTSKHLIKKYAGVSSLILSDSLQKKRLERWNKFWTDEKKMRLIATLEKEGSALKFKPSAFNPFKDLLNRNFPTIDGSEMEELKKNFAGDYLTEQPGHCTVVTLLKVSSENKPAVYQAFENVAHSMVIDKQYLTDSFVQVINSDFTRIALFSGILVFAVLLLTYGRIELTLVSFIPMFITFVWILGIMAMAGIPFNLINIILSALIFGLGDDYSLFIMDGLLGQYKSGKQNLSSFKSSIILSAITTVAGLGVLIFARHPALKSIAVISIIGMLCVVSMAQILIPFFFAALITDRIKKNRYPWTFSSLLKSVFAFTYFVLGSILLTLTGFLVLKLNPFAKEKGKYFFHFILSKITGSLIYVMVNVKKKILNPGKEDFSKPAVVICNHQSFLDILSLVMLHPKLILLTNNWVWNSRVFGAVVRMADYYPVIAEGAEKSIELLEERIKQGYSVAFYLAERLHIDILPIILHGTGYTMTKGDFMLKDGTITLKFLERIKPDDPRFGKGYAERSKQIGRYFREQYRILQLETEQTAYFREKLLYNYLYKGPLIEWYLKIKLRLEKNYQLFHQLLPEKGKILDIGCGYGFMSYLLHFTSPQREITGIDYDEEKIEVANNCFTKNGNINFVLADIINYPMEKSDGIILADILHYLPPERQEEVIEKCIKNLNPGGTLVIRDGNKDLEGRHRFTRLTEFFSTRLFAFNKTSGNDLSFLSASMIREIAVRLGMSCDEIDNTRHTSNIIFVIKHAG
jgi:2-polyprenyl-3-methyl-5-hydroxy-6-metoxy-1,4-benzoquinol methylase